ncbi:Co/Zn/Cd efflux system component (CzcD) [Commensalibacter communis]|uniref:Co/Zn/Cd efflux system component (CzcD) n=1 Tax=Commensalibacter communis TaxID=2972786 RepID=A0A9W4TRQ5_9PROT|nr:cation diffusion facilitator family transporter [Commensalibacter communis]CAI3950272.1 Co/Zn/Cd efflux system component (CzcD) [Commensalibacter communis]CAI3950773.1 Co/Zn/Cd efflux system component (CzcD) [Commensalibacter communis]CAI3951791.1 Co/Zn/Cd efflux system component (CzcD) [Commensalibacter communis]CAI3956226.1 Co/Zn/Cd efflux system component (CzcD) [Commensalibacter communis]CAI3957156.1 Co/Zn/Cd efflux system component (CzcD) [Commensalibacter communis]
MSDHSTHHHEHDHSHDDHHGCDGHSHTHSHSHAHGHHHVPKSFGTAFAVGITLNLIYVIAEAAWGFWGNSLALLADAGHNLSDILALACAWIAAILGQKKPTDNFTYGYRRTSILASLTNAVILLIVTGGIILEAIERIFHPAPVAGWTVIIVAAIGVVVNGVTAMMFASGHKEDLNIKGAFLHMAYDALLSLGVVITGIIILFTNFNLLDPIISLVVSIVIIMGTWSLLKDSVTLAVDGVPTNINRKNVEQYLRALPSIVDLHDLHIWAMSTTETALTVHLVSNVDHRLDDFLSVTSQQLKDQFKIGHTTIQIELQHEAEICLLAHAETV